jgi:asparagine synthetase B (glutamine-hydrolysing)
MALYFAARGVGKVRNSPEAQPEPYTSPARVLLNGLGADELLGGYGRHRTAFKAGGWPAVIDEVGQQRSHVVVNILVISSRAAPTRY